MSVPATLVKELRDRTSAGILDCRKALEACEGDISAAVDWLRKKGLSDAARKTGRIAAEGMVGIAASDDLAAMVEVNSETDFVARSEGFQKLVGDIAAAALEVGKEDLESLLAAQVGGKAVSDLVQEASASVGEHLALRRVACLSAQGGCLATYIHNRVGPQMGSIGVLVALDPGGHGREEAMNFARQVAMHVAASRPLALDEGDLDPDALARERTVLEEQARESGRPPEVIEKMVEGRMRKFIGESCLLKQPFAIEPKISVAEALAKAGESMRIAGFRRFQTGEGMETRQEDFAEEVRKAAGG